MTAPIERTPAFEIKDDWGIAKLEAAKVEIERRMVELDEDMAGIRSQLLAAKVRHSNDGIRADGGWFIRASDALRHKGRHRLAAQNALGAVNRRLRRLRAEQNLAAQKTKDSLFVMAARRLLSEEEYLRIWAQADRGRAP